MSRVELVSEEHVEMYVYKNEIMFRCLILRNIINGRSLLEIAHKFKENGKYEHRNIICSVCPYVRKNILRVS